MAYYDPHAMQLQQQHAGYSMDPRAASLWMGELEPWMDENWIRAAFYSAGHQVSVKMIRDKFTGANAGYCFVDLASPEAATSAIGTLNGTVIPGTDKTFKLNWASGGNPASGGPGGNEYSVFVGDLSPEVTDYMLLTTFQAAYSSVRSAKIMTDPTTGQSRGYGFVRFGDESEQLRSIEELQGVYCGSRPMRLSVATPKPKSNLSAVNVSAANASGSASGPASASGMGYSGFTSPVQPIAPQQDAYNQFADPNNTTVFIGGLTSVVHEDELRGLFATYGDISYVKIPPGKGCGFVQYVHRASAEMAINQLNGYQVGMSRMRLSWGRAQYEPKPYYGSSGYMGYGQSRGYAYNASYPSGADSSEPSSSAYYPSDRDPLEKVPVEQRNRRYVHEREGVMKRLDDSSDWRSARATA
ncbi:hypothetical protein BGZ74_001648 [Mortierella antarctica]|nr:hypothetical protein BGZ74_001648 [Mortierella antarctica]KAG0348633.1 hypothetical protein BG005_011399 [Podila minutissima]